MARPLVELLHASVQCFPRRGVGVRSGADVLRGLVVQSPGGGVISRCPPGERVALILENAPAYIAAYNNSVFAVGGAVAIDSDSPAAIILLVCHSRIRGGRSVVENGISLTRVIEVANGHETGGG
jgi:hypothetical protein